MMYGTFNGRKQPKPPFDKIIHADEDLQQMVCPITLEKIQVLLAKGECCVIFIDGKTYEKTSLLTWLKNHATAPNSNLPLDHYQKQYKLAPLQPNQAALFLEQQKRHQLYLLRFKRGASLTVCLSSLTGLAILSSKYGLSDEQTAVITFSFLIVLLLVSAFYFLFHLCPPRAVVPQIEQNNNPSTDDLDSVYRQYASLMIPFDARYYNKPAEKNVEEPDLESAPTPSR